MYQYSSTALLKVCDISYQTLTYNENLAHFVLTIHIYIMCHHQLKRYRAIILGPLSPSLVPKALFDLLKDP